MLDHERPPQWPRGKLAVQWLLADRPGRRDPARPAGLVAGSTRAPCRINGSTRSTRGHRMPHLAHGAAAHRDSKLLRIRKLSLWITGGAVAASLGLGAAFAHALPGHSHATAASGNRGARSQVTGPPSGSGQSGASGRATTSHRTQTGSGHHRQGGLAPPQQRPAPAPTQTQPVVSSGGS